MFSGKESYGQTLLSKEDKDNGIIEEYIMFI
jgi:hypothetical protein